MNNGSSTPSIVSSDHPVTIIGGAEVNPADLSVALNFAPTIVAADGGANHLSDWGVSPLAVIGDLDSLSHEARLRYAGRLHHVSEQDSVDFDKALRNVAAPLVVALGVTGGRMDHQLAAFNVLARHAERPCVLLGSGAAITICPPRIVLDLARGTDVSLFPLTRLSVKSGGLEWPTDGIEFSPDGRIGTANRAKGPCWFEAERAGMLLILPDHGFPALVTALMTPEASRWPVPEV